MRSTGTVWESRRRFARHDHRAPTGDTSSWAPTRTEAAVDIELRVAPHERCAYGRSRPESNRCRDRRGHDRDKREHDHEPTARALARRLASGRHVLIAFRADAIRDQAASLLSAQPETSGDVPGSASRSARIIGSSRRLTTSLRWPYRAPRTGSPRGSSATVVGHGGSAPRTSQASIPSPTPRS